MAIKFKIDKKVQDALGIRVVNNKIVKSYSILVPEVRKEFRKSAVKPIRKAVLRDMTKGISPVRGFGKFPVYSPSYLDFISGKLHFRKLKSGKTIKIDGPDPLLAAASPRKRKSPVTLRFSGQLHNALKVFTTGGFTETFRLVFDWRDFLANIHNKEGAGKAKTVRRMLPTESGEDFNREITKQIFDRLKRAAKVIAKRFS